jgi:hypothetical protein
MLVYQRVVTADHFAAHVLQPQSSDRGDWITEPRHVRQIREFQASPKVSIMWFIQYHPKSGKSMKIYIFLYIHGIYQINFAFMSCFYMFLSFPPQKYGDCELGRLGAWYLAAPWPQGPRGSDGPGSHSGPGAGGTPGPSIIPEVNGGSMGKSSFPYSNP